MSKQKKDALFSLIKSLTKAEKRNFKLIANRTQGQSDKLFVQLFDEMDKSKVWDEKKVFHHIKDLKRHQLSNLKSNLYRQILNSLRHLNKKTSIEIQLRDNIDFAEVLYAKGLYMAALNLIMKAKKQSKEYQLNTIHYELLEIEKRIETLPVTGSMHPKADELTEESKLTLQHICINDHLSNLSLLVYGFYLRNGFVKNEAECKKQESFFQTQLSMVDDEDLDFYGKLYYFQAHAWHYYTIQDFLNYFKFAQKWVHLYDDETRIIRHETSMFIKGYHNLLNALFITNKVDKFLKYYDNFLLFKNQKGQRFSQNQKILISKIELTHGVNKFILQTQFSAGAVFLDEHLEHFQSLIAQWDLVKQFNLNYKIGCIYFGADRWEDCIFFLNKIINQVKPDFKEDIQCFARILNLLAHFELDNRLHLTYQIRSVYRFIAKMEELQTVQKEIFIFLRQSVRIRKDELPKEFVKLKKRLVLLQDKPYEGRPFLYLDLISWLESKIKNQRMEDIMREKFIAKHNKVG